MKLIRPGAGRCLAGRSAILLVAGVIASVARRSLVAQTQVDATLGDAGFYLVN